MNLLDNIINHSVPPGIYRFSGAEESSALSHTVTTNGWLYLDLGGQSITDKPTFLAACATAMQFPNYFGYNWDAFEEVLHDMVWGEVSGCVILYDEAAQFADNAPTDWRMALKIVRRAIQLWQAENVAVYLLLRGLDNQPDLAGVTLL